MDFNKRSDVVQLTSVEKVYNTGKDIVFRALKGIDLNIKEGEFVAIMGPSGSGKSTMMNILGCLDSLTTGEYLLSGTNIKELTDDELADIRNKKIGFVFQSFNLLPKLKAWENVALPLTYAGIHARERKQKALDALESVGIKDRAMHLPSELSGGQRQRVAIARALAGGPDIIMADEPTGNLDSRSEEEVLEIFKKLNAEGATIIMVTHEENVGQHCKRIVRFKDGKLVKDEVIDHEFYRDF